MKMQMATGFNGQNTLTEALRGSEEAPEHGYIHSTFRTRSKVQSHFRID